MDVSLSTLKCDLMLFSVVAVVEHPEYGKVIQLHSRERRRGTFANSSLRYSMFFWIRNAFFPNFLNTGAGNHFAEARRFIFAGK